MRIIGGRHRGRRLIAPAGGATRPTSDRVREAIFNILIHRLDGSWLAGATVLDVFAGSGALGLEALSRGAAHATFIDHDAAALAAIRRNGAALGETDRMTLLRLDATRLGRPPPTAGTPAALAFVDAPYGLGLTTPALVGLAVHGWLAVGALAVVEAGAREPFTVPSAYHLEDERAWGPARVVFLRHLPPV